jgi:hypothetical protein
MNDNNNKNNTLPEYIQGIPTAKNKSRERRSLIAMYYSNLWKRLQRENHNNRIYNDYLGVDVFIIKNESDKKTINAASRNWQSTYAVKNLYTIVKYAACDDNTVVFFAPKNGTQSDNHYKNIAVLYYDFVNTDVSYLNFKVKLTIGIRSNNKHVQYCVNKIEVKEKKPTVPSNSN